MNKESLHSEQFIEQKVNKKQPFSVSKGYFENFDSTIYQKTKEQNFPKTTAFKVSDTYFKNLEDRIISKLPKNKKTLKVVRFKKYVLNIIPFAAAAAILLFIGLTTYNFKNNSGIDLDSLTESDFEYWLETNPINTNDIAIVLNQNILDETPFYFTQIEDESIEEFVNTNNNSFLINELDE